MAILGCAVVNVWIVFEVRTKVFRNHEKVQIRSSTPAFLATPEG